MYDQATEENMKKIIKYLLDNRDKTTAEIAEELDVKVEIIEVFQEGLSHLYGENAYPEFLS